MSEKLHTVRSNHAIFKGPLPVVPTLTDEVDRKTKRHVQAWKVHEQFKPGVKTQQGWVPGSVVLAPNLRDAEDSEIISGGMNEKGDFGVALAREANIFYWGPPAAPRHMTEEAKRVFVNTLVYMKQFRGAKQTVRRGVKPRTGLLTVMRWGNRATSASPLANLANDDRIKFLNRFFPPEIVKSFGPDPEKYRAFYEPNLGYVFVPQGTFSIDEEARSIGVPNNQVQFLDTCIQLLRKPAEAAKARRLLERYTRLSFPNADAWQQWLSKNRDALYFSDFYGYGFFTGSAGPAPNPDEVRAVTQEMTLAPPSDSNPVSAGAAAVGYIQEKDSTFIAEKGGLISLVVRLKIANGWHTYAGGRGNSQNPTTINVELPAGARWQGDWKTPPARDGAEPGVAEYHGDIIFTRLMYFAKVPGNRSRPDRALVTVRGSVKYEASNGKLRLPPGEVPFEASVTVMDR